MFNLVHYFFTIQGLLVGFFYDVHAVDRGFREAAHLLKEFWIESYMPHFMTKSQKQHTVEEANVSRLVTIVRICQC